MILKRLYDEYDLAVERIILNEYKNLGLTMPEMQVLLAFFSIDKRRRTFSISSLAKRVEFNHDEIAKHLTALLDKKFIRIDLEVGKDKKEREVFDLSRTFKKIEDFLLEDCANQLKAQYENDCLKTIQVLEKKFNRLLKPYELETVRNWYEKDNFTEAQINKAILIAQDKASLKTIERILNTEIPSKIEIDKNVEEVLDNLFKKIR